ncbi:MULTISPECIES: protein-disulfide reductase DsbD family protein [Hyphomicrobiales]|uniref:Thiol:disulfide interchange protein DsbD n=2 Tax=Martelella TaxID=293088 RepID=A0A1U9Z9C6_9HYPH|nr:MULTISPECIES: protein-disulfide reductase DsbD domain-containing protein [Hyphomicrobiales]AQZ54317.1 Thiol:disulfide interchange protein DsbD precursor [Martelella mediterranea DSM 17316]MDV2968069.1 protein-disulfide reductase DsbD family protein [Nitratireductor aquimarinus]
MNKFSRLFVAKLILLVCLGFLGAGLASMSNAAESGSFSNPALEARLIAAENGVGPNATSLSAGLHLELGEGWKTYWRSPGEVGIPPSIDWAGSENVEEVELLWPAPERFTAFGIENFGYHDEVVFPLRIALSDPGAPVRLNANVTLLTCSTVCVPQEFTLTLSLPRASGIDADAAALISAYAEKVPEEGAESGISIQSAYLDPDMTALTLVAHSERPFAGPDVFPELGAGTAFGKPDIRLGDGGRLLWARLPVLSAAADLPDLRITVTDGDRAASLFTELADAAPQPPFALDRVLPGLAELAWIAAIAFLGGLVLNVMPCVLPVLSIKLSSAMKSRDQGVGRIRKGFAVSALGVLAFMWSLAALTLAARGLGMTVGWGLQFQNPVFLAVMFIVLAVFSANLFGAFEIELPSSLQTRLARAGGGKGYSGDFATGAFAAILATPCSAPFLGTAVAFALAGRLLDIAVIFTALGIGLALPYLIVAAFPAAISRLPKPGRWMLWLKILLGLALAGTAGWLFWVLIGVGGMTSALAVLTASAVLVVILSFSRLAAGARLSGAAATGALAIFLAGFLSAAGTPNAKPATDWAAFDRREIPKLVSRGEVVFVDVTADWCLTCKANKALVLDRAPVRTALRAPGVTAMQADWTRPDEAISRYLETFDRYGIPFNAVYGPGAPEGIVLPELLSSEAVLSALEKAAERAVASGG